MHFTNIGSKLTLPLPDYSYGTDIEFVFLSPTSGKYESQHNSMFALITARETKIYTDKFNLFKIT